MHLPRGKDDDDDDPDPDEPTFPSATLTEVAFATKWRWAPQVIQDMSVREVQDYMAILGHFAKREEELLKQKQTAQPT